MSLHRFIPPPPLALLVHPAPPAHSSKRDDKDKNKDGKDKDKDKDKGKDVKDDKHKKDDANKNPADDDNKHNDDGGKMDNKGAKQPKSPAIEKAKAAAEVPEAPPTPATPASDIPEPGTPADGIPQSPDTPRPRDTSPVPAPNPSNVKDTSDKKNNDGSKEDPAEPEEVLPPIRLTGPPPHRPVRTRLDLDLSRPYPPIDTDPRGAYHKYAKAAQNEIMFIDVTKDGWLFEQWRERTERVALARLRGEDEKQRKREIQAALEKSEIRKLPKTSEELLLQLWNDLVDAPSQELPVEEFWARYDWSDPEAQAYLLPAKKKETSTEDNDSADKPDEIKDKEQDAKEDTGPAWSKEGVEEILATVGVQCVYNSKRALSRDYTQPAGGYLIMGHNFFMLRLEDVLQWKSEEAANQFELLVSSGHDRVFGEMVKAQQAEERRRKDKEYRERKKEEKRKADEEKAKRGDKEDVKDTDAKEPQGDKNTKHRDEQAENKEDISPVTPKNNTNAKNGEVDKPAKEIEQDKNSGKVVLALPIEGQEVGKVPEEAKHEAEVIAAHPDDDKAKEKDAEAKEDHEDKGDDKDRKDDEDKDKKEKVDKDKKEKDDKDKRDDKEKKADKDHHKKHRDERPFDPVKEAEVFAKMMQAAGGGDMDAPVAMEDIKMAFKALELAAEQGGMTGMLDIPGFGKGGSGGSKKDGKKDSVPVIWTWHDSCERWRWRNYEAGLHEIGPGGWEERDWKVFADDRGCDEFETEMEILEAEEEDVHDWSC